MKATASRLCSILAHLFGDSLDRLTLWKRIGTALTTACDKVADDDLDRFVTLCLEHVQADPAQAAACDPLRLMIETFDARPPEWRHAFINFIKTHNYVVLTRGRDRWQRVMAKEIDL